MENKYTINVAENMGERADSSIKWAHFFRVDAGPTYEKAQDIFFSLKNAYPEHMVTVTHWRADGAQLNW